MRSAGPSYITDLQKRERVRFWVEVRRILVPTDLTAGSRKVVKYAATLAARCGAQLTVLHVYSEPYNIAYLRGSPAYAWIEWHLHDTRNALESFGREIKERCGSCRTEFRIGIPCEEIIKAAQDLQIDLLVLSTHPHKWFRRLACGSNEQELLRRVACPVLLVHEDKHSSYSLN